MTSRYDKDDITFQYPENWTLNEEPSHGFPRTIFVTAESGAFWSVAVYPRHEASLVDLSRQYEQALDSEYEDVEFDDYEIDLPSGSISAIECSFYCLDFLVRSRTISVQLGDRNALVAWQAEDREFDQYDMVFLAITFSLLGTNRETEV